MLAAAANFKIFTFYNHCERTYRLVCAVLPLQDKKINK